MPVGVRRTAPNCMSAARHFAKRTCLTSESARGLGARRNVMPKTYKSTGGSPAEHTRLVSGIYDSVYAPGVGVIAEIEAKKIIRQKLRKPTKDENPEERRQRWRENAKSQ